MALGGDGFMLHTLHEMLDGDRACVPVFGMNRGTVGFLMNEWRIDRPRRADRAAPRRSRVAPLEMRATTVDGETLHPFGDQRGLAAARNPPDGEDRDFGERPRRAARAGLRRRAGGDARGLDRLQPLRARPDPAPAAAKLLALTPISPFRPRRWRARSFRTTARSASACSSPKTPGLGGRRPDRGPRRCEGRNLRSTATASLTLLFDPEHALDERITMEQFADVSRLAFASKSQLSSRGARKGCSPVAQR